MLYACESCGIQPECDVDESGQRICPECGKDVTGIVTRPRDTRRSPPKDSSHAAGNIKWTAEIPYRVIVVDAFNHHEAAVKAAQKIDNPQKISEIKPTATRYRA